QQHGAGRTDAMGTLAGRLKRRWVAERREADAKRALELYRDAMEIASAREDWDQSYYHSINVAFLTLAFERNRQAATDQARSTLEYCVHATAGKWRSASEGEANLILGDRQSALEAYQKALEFMPSRREAEAMLRQATWVTEI